MTSFAKVSEQWFKSKFDHPETSTLVQRILINANHSKTALDKGLTLSGIELLLKNYRIAVASCGRNLKSPFSYYRG